MQEDRFWQAGTKPATTMKYEGVCFKTLLHRSICLYMKYSQLIGFLSEIAKIHESMRLTFEAGAKSHT